jgi:polyisoprenoid-binding protein YceI
VGIEPTSAQEGPSVRAKKRTPPPVKQPEEKNEKGFAAGPDAMTHFVIDTASKRNEVVFTSKAPKETIKGKVASIKGQLDLNPRKLDAATGNFTVEWKNVDTGNKMRNSHMMHAPWVQTESHPAIVFTVTGLEMGKVMDTKGKTIKVKMIGKLAMNGKEKDTKIGATLAYIEPAAGKTGKDSLGVKASFKIALADFDIKGRGVGDKVAAEQAIKVSLVLKQADAADSKDDTKVSSAK